MGKGHFPGGGTVIRVGEDGTVWPPEPDGRGPQGKKPKGKRGDNLPPPLDSEEQAQREQEAIARFILECAAAYNGKRLTETEPRPPRLLRPMVSKAQGNISWMSTSRVRRNFFHQALCEVKGEQIPYENVWRDRR